MAILLSLRDGLAPFVALQYPAPALEHPDSFPDSSYYNVGKLDLCMVLTIIVVMTVLRDASMRGIFAPYARWILTRNSKARPMPMKSLQNGVFSNTNGHSKVNGYYANGHGSTNHRKEARRLNRSVLRFAEQGWSVVYYSLQWCFGVYVHTNLPTRVLDPVDAWLNYPHVPLAAPLKFYYLSQTAFYLHQMLILNVEARRKDHVQMMTHHIVTVALMAASYFMNFTRSGALIMVLMDWCDIFLPLAKMLGYIKAPKMITDAVFTWFLVSWFVTRHILFPSVIKSTVFDAPRLIHFEWAPEKGHYWTRNTYLAFCTMLIALEVMQCIWFWMICRVAWRVVSGQGAADERSDDDGKDE